MPRSVFTGVVVGIVIACTLGIRAVAHSLPTPSKKPWAEWSLVAKRDFARANLHHSRFAIRWLRQHRSSYQLADWRERIAEHKRLRTKARRNLVVIEAKLHPPFQYPWWWVPLGICETGVNPPDPAYGAPGHPGGDGYHGWINWLPSTWLAYGGAQFAQYAYDASEYEQYVVTMRMHADVPWSQSNPACSARIGM